MLKAKAVLCPGLEMRLAVEKTGEKEAWIYTGGLEQYLRESLEGGEWLPEDPFTGSIEGEMEGVDWAVAWRTDGGTRVEESYVNLIPTMQGGTHVNGFRLGLTEAIREFCEFRNLLPRGLKLAPEDVWDDASYVLSTKMRDPQFAGQTKERLTSREPAAFVSGIVKDQFGLWLNQHPEAGEGIAQLAIGNAQDRLKASQKVARKRVVSGPALPGKLADCIEPGSEAHRALPGRGRLGGRLGQAGARSRVPGRDAAARQDPEHLGSGVGRDPLLAGSARHHGRDRRGPGLRRHLRRSATTRSASSRTRTRTALHIATLLCALFLRHFRPLVLAGHVFVAMPPLYRIDYGKQVEYALDEAERNGVLDRIRAENPRAKPVVTRFKGLGEMSALQLRETTMATETRRLVQLTVDAKDQADQIDGHDARQEAGRRPPRVARDQGQPGCRAALSPPEYP